MQISREQIDAISSDELLGPAVASGLSDPLLAFRPSASLTELEWDDLHDACLEACMNVAPVVETFDAEQDKGVYTVAIHGVPGAYYVFAPEFDMAGLFSSLDEARCDADDVHGEFRVREGGNEEDEADEEWVEQDPREPAFPDRLLSVLAGSDDSPVIAALRERVVADEILVLLANGLCAPEGIAPSDEAASWVSTFEKSLPKPQGYIEGMGRMMTIPRLSRRVELFQRVNGRLPDADETSALYELE